MNNIKKFKEFKLNEQILPIPIGIAAMSFINKLFGSDPTKVRLIFPQKNWEKIGNYLMKKFGVITEFFESLSQAISKVKEISKSKINVKELVIGSHGSEGTLLMTESEGGFYFDNTFINELKTIVNPNTKVFFTACSGADYLDSLKDAAERLGVRVYGSAGIYNYITNESEKGFYYCEPTKIAFKSISDDGKIRPVSIDNIPASVEIENMGYEYFPQHSIYLDVTSEGGEKQTSGDVKREFMITIPKELMLEDLKLTKIITNQKGGYSEYNDDNLFFKKSAVRDQQLISKFNISIHSILFEYLKTRPDLIKKGKSSKDKNIKDLFTNEFKTNFSNSDSDEEIIDSYRILKAFDNGLVKIFYKNKQNKWVDVKTIKPYIKEGIDNDFLLKNGYCRKCSAPPISWINN